MKLQRNVIPIIIILFFASGVAAFGYTKVRSYLGASKNTSSLKKSVLTNKPGVLGSFNLPEVEKINLGSPSAQPADILKATGENLAQETEKITKEILNNVTETVKEAVVNNISINQEKIVQDVTAKLLQSLLSQAGSTGQSVDRAVYDACTNIVKKAENTPTPTP